MKNRIRISLTLVILALLIITSTANAQYAGYNWYTAYQVVNIGDSNADIDIDYYDANGVVQTAAHKSFLAVPPGSSRLVMQFSDDPNLPPGNYSAVINATQPVAVIANQQLVSASSSTYNPVPPFSSYSGQDSGGAKVTLPAVMYNWYNYYTELFIMNVGGGNATDVDITYIPGMLNGQSTGASGVVDNNNSIALYATLIKSQKTMTSLGAPSGTYAGRFIGSAVVQSDQPIIAVVNEHNAHDYKLMSYNGFTDAGSTSINLPAVLRGWYGYYTNITIANPSASATAHIAITYTPGAGSVAAAGSTLGPFSVNYDIAPQTALNRYDGPTGNTVVDSDMVTAPHVFTKFYGSAVVTSDIPVVALVNEEAVATGDDQAGSYNGIPTSSATNKIVVPVILADYYGYYTNLVVQNVTSTAGTCDVTYTSDANYSAVPNHSATYTHSLPANGTFVVYEGRKGGQEVGDINHDTQWRTASAQRFIGAASIICHDASDNPINAIAIVNEEKDVSLRDSMYTMNAFNK
jgi:hypothetical protein